MDVRKSGVGTGMAKGWPHVLLKEITEASLQTNDLAGYKESEAEVHTSAVEESNGSEGKGRQAARPARERERSASPQLEVEAGGGARPVS